MGRREGRLGGGIYIFETLKTFHMLRGFPVGGGGEENHKKEREKENERDCDCERQKGTVRN